jgi:hypothetical protein
VHEGSDILPTGGRMAAIVVSSRPKAWVGSARRARLQVFVVRQGCLIGPKMWLSGLRHPRGAHSSAATSIPRPRIQEATVASSSRLHPPRGVPRRTLGTGMSGGSSGYMIASALEPTPGLTPQGSPTPTSVLTATVGHHTAAQPPKLGIVNSQPLWPHTIWYLMK